MPATSLRVDSLIAQQAAEQWGLVTLDDALGVGMTFDQVRRRVRSGRWELLARGVYRVGGTPRSWQQTTMAACMAGAPTAVASHLSAAALVGLSPPPPRPHVTVAYGLSVRSPLARAHRSRLSPLDVEARHRIPTTTVPRTLVDCASVLGRAPFQRLVDSALHSRTTSVDAIERAQVRAGPRRGRALLTTLLAPWRGPIEPGSSAEVRLLRVLADWGYPAPAKQVKVRDASEQVVARLDLGWPHQLIGIEYDSGEFHGPGTWARDEARHQLVTALGWTVLHADKPDLHPGERSLRDQLDRAWRPTIRPCA